MTKEHSGEERLAELTWRTVKLRVSLLVITILSLLIVWSALINGDKQAREVDIKFCQQLVEESNKQSQLSLSSPHSCTPDEARNFVEGMRSANQITLRGSQALAESNKEAADKLLQLYIHKKEQFAEYDEKRRDAYPLQIQLSSEYSGSHVALNGRFVAKLLPFCVLIVLSVVALLGFQQDAYQHQLASILTESHDEQDRVLRIARGQFFAAAVQGRGWTNLRSRLISPEKLSVGALLLFSLTLFLTVLFEYISKIIDLTSSVLFNYPSAILGTVFVLTYWLWRARKHYGQFHHPVAQDAVTTSHRFKTIRTVQWSKLCLVLVGVFTLLLPWANGPGFSGNVLRGFRFFLRQPTLSQTGDYIIAPIDPSIFFEIRIQVTVALLFLLLCALSSGLKLRGRKLFAKPLHIAQRILAIVVLFLSLNYLLYMGILQSGSELEDNPFLRMFFSNTFGMPMSVYDPAYGFIIFLACCFSLIWLTLREGEPAR